MPKKVAVLGASGGIGQPLCMLLKLSKYVDELSCYDVVRTPGVAADLSHIPTKATVSGFLPSPACFPPPKGDSGLEATLKGADIVVIPAGVPRKPGMTRDDLFNTNAGIIKKLIEGCADYCPNAFIAVITNPVNSTVPIASKVLKAKGVYNPKKLCGVTTLDACRANTFAGKIIGKDPKDIDVTVVGGHSGISILPLYSQLDGFTNKLSDEDLKKLTYRTQFGGDEVVAAKAGAGSATLSMAYAGYVFTENVLRALNGEKGITQCAYVESSLHAETAFFASPCKFGSCGIEEIMEYGEISDYEKELLEKMLPELQKQIKKGLCFC